MTSSNDHIKIEPQTYDSEAAYYAERPNSDIQNGSSESNHGLLISHIQNGSSNSNHEIPAEYQQEYQMEAENEVLERSEATNYEEGGAEGTKRKAPTGRCKVCGDDASGMYFGALVCVSCKTFFLRYDGNEVNFICKGFKCCPVTVKSRTQCKYCRYHRCLEAGMYRRVRPAQVQASEGQQLCAVCGDIGNGIHFGAITCEGCKKFFRRGLTEQCSYVCMNDTQCVINPRTRNSCRFCRYQKCLKIGMSRDAIQMGRPSKVSHDPTAAGVKRPEASHRPRKNPSSDFDRNLTTAPYSNTKGSVYELHREYNTTQHDNFQALDLSRNSSRQDLMELNQRSSLEGSFSDAQMRRMNDERGSETDSQPDSTVVLPEMSGMALRALLERGFHNVQQRVLLTELVERVVQDFSVKIANQNAEYRASMAGSQQYSAVSQPASCELNASKLLSTCASLAQNKRKLSDVATTSSLQPSGSSDKSNAAKSESDDYESFKPKKFKASTYASTHSSRTVGSDKRESVGSPAGERAKDAAFGQAIMISNQGTTSASSSNVPRAEARGKVFSRDESRECSSPSVSSSVVISDDEVKKELDEDGLAASSSSAEGSSVVRARPEKVTVDVEKLVEVSRVYWSNPLLPDENVLIAERHWDVINRIIPAYDRFVHTGTNINRTLKMEFEESIKSTDSKQVLSSWIQSKVVPEYTTASVSYCKSLIGFSDFDPDDQVTIIRLGQSPSRILVAALHWFDSDRHRFRNFLSWRESSNSNGKGDLFKQKLVEYSEDLTLLELDPIEAALLNVLLIVATDYPSLKNTSIIEETRQKILATFTAYATAKFGTPNNRLEVLFSYMPEVRRLGLLHHQMTKTRTMTAEEVEQQLL